MKKDIDTLIAEERAEIINKYEKGRHEGVHIKPWEDADYSVYRVTDRFGFLHEKELPTPTAVEEKYKLQEVEREEKWVKMVKKWEKYQNSEKMMKRVYKGIPLKLRGQAWALLLDVEKVKQANYRKYETMKEQAKKYSTEIKQIDLDVNRTFRNHIMFMERFGVKKLKWSSTIKVCRPKCMVRFQPCGLHGLHSHNRRRSTTILFAQAEYLVDGSFE